MSIKNILLLLTLISFSFFNCKDENQAVTNPAEDASPKTIVELIGPLKTAGNRIVGKADTAVVLRGMSLFWSQWGGKYYNEECVRWLRDDWKCTIVRASVGIESGGYLSNPDAEMQKAETVINAAINLGIYVIVDWHDHHAENHLEEAKEFFKTIAQKYGDRPNLIYEIYNEPMQVSWSKVVKPYAVEVIKTIREYDPDNLIVVGNPTWSQDVDVAAKDPIDDVNVAYSLHFYSSTHRQYNRTKAANALANGAALFVTEYGLSEASGNGNIDMNEANRWFDFMEQNKLSSCNWSVMDKNESSAALKPGASATGGWNESDLTLSGNTIRNYIRSHNAPLFELLTKQSKR
ncbi:glycoside hydrolase family 5 protein [Melioribacter sp. Ez-97]|uniref:glycoside hydrolase family 5 protein n=1 Tax=Melioribacter sp. Ez-97 TaxID=3423434 RepID=UPI003EDB4D38